MYAQNASRKAVPTSCWLIRDVATQALALIAYSRQVVRANNTTRRYDLALPSAPMLRDPCLEIALRAVQCPRGHVPTLKPSIHASQGQRSRGQIDCLQRLPAGLFFLSPPQAPQKRTLLACQGCRR